MQEYYNKIIWANQICYYMQLLRICGLIINLFLT